MADVTIKTGYSDHHDDDRKMWHVYPLDDKQDHITHQGHDCFCEPRIIQEGERLILIHDALDGRE